jgi:alpha-D-xyloside xylohydrolase
LKGIVKTEGPRLVWRYDDEILWIEPWGEDSLRVRATRMGRMPEKDWALLPQPAGAARCEITDDEARIENGRLTAVISRVGALRFEKPDGTVLLREQWQDRQDAQRRMSLITAAREMKPIHGGKYRIAMTFEANDGEKIFGMGQYQIPQHDLKGCELELAQRNSQVPVPFYQSSLGYGFLWHNPAVGRAVLARNHTRFTAEVGDVIDYWITAGETPREIHCRYMRATGLPSAFPDWALGLWQSKLRYRTQDELMRVAREYKRRGVPLSVIVCDFFHWPTQGDWCFDERYWPDPKAMVDELREMGIELMVSIWTTVDPRSDSYAEMKRAGYLVRTDTGVRTQMVCLGADVFYDPTNPEARGYLFEKVKRNYMRHGIRLFWLDVAEPEYSTYDFENYRYHIGTCLETAGMYPRCYGQGFYEGLRAEGEAAPVTLARSFWVGAAKYGMILWSGDIHSRFEVLRTQFTAGLNASMAGVAWWTTDIGGFYGGDPDTPYFRELMVRWFQYGAFCPVFRLHGWRMPTGEDTEKVDTGLFDFDTCGDGELWSFGEAAYGIMKDLVLLRQKLTPYLRRCFDQASAEGEPIMRPLFYNFPGDERCWTAHQQMMLGEDLLIAPVLYEGMTRRDVYLPAGKTWVSLRGGEYAGGTTIGVDAPIDVVPVFYAKGSMIGVLL